MPVYILFLLKNILEDSEEICLGFNSKPGGHNHPIQGNKK